MEDVAARVLLSDKYAGDTKELAASVLAQANKQRYPFVRDEGRTIL